MLKRCAEISREEEQRHLDAISYAQKAADEVFQKGSVEAALVLAGAAATATDKELILSQELQQDLAAVACRKVLRRWQLAAADVAVDKARARPMARLLRYGPGLGRVGHAAAAIAIKRQQALQLQAAEPHRQALQDQEQAVARARQLRQETHQQRLHNEEQQQQQRRLEVAGRFHVLYVMQHVISTWRGASSISAALGKLYPSHVRTDGLEGASRRGQVEEATVVEEKTQRLLARLVQRQQQQQQQQQQAPVQDQAAPTQLEPAQQEAVEQLPAKGLSQLCGPNISKIANTGSTEACKGAVVHHCSLPGGNAVRLGGALKTIEHDGQGPSHQFLQHQQQQAVMRYSDIAIAVDVGGTAADDNADADADADDVLQSLEELQQELSQAAEVLQQTVSSLPSLVQQTELNRGAGSITAPSTEAVKFAPHHADAASSRDTTLDSTVADAVVFQCRQGLPLPRSVSPDQQQLHLENSGQQPQQHIENSQQLLKLVARLGIKPWVALAQVRQQQEAAAGQMRRVTLLKAAMLACKQALYNRYWRRIGCQVRAVGKLQQVKEQHLQRFALAALAGWTLACRQHKHQVLLRCCAAWRMAVHQTQQLLQAAGEAQLLRHQRHVLQAWKVVAADQAHEQLVLELQLQQVAADWRRRRRQQGVLHVWHQHAVAATLERHQAAKRQETWGKVRGWLEEAQAAKSSTAGSSMMHSPVLESSIYAGGLVMAAVGSRTGSVCQPCSQGVLTAGTPQVTHNIGWLRLPASSVRSATGKAAQRYDAMLAPDLEVDLDVDLDVDSDAGQQPPAAGDGQWVRVPEDDLYARHRFEMFDTERDVGYDNKNGVWPAADV
eukprot:gene11840-11984_t